MIEKVIGSTVRIDFTTHDTTGALVAPSSAFASDGSDFRIYKDGSASEKTTVNGITVTSPFDSIVGKHLIEIDTNNSTGDSGFWAVGSEYRVELHSAKTIDGILQSGVKVGQFRLVSADVLRTLGTNAPTDWLDAAAVKTDAVTKIQAGLSTYAGGDTSGTTTLLARLTSTRAGLLDNLSNLDVAVSVIQSQITALNNLSAKANWFGYPQLEVPDAGTRAYVFELIVRDDEDKLVNLDSSPTIALVNAAGTDRSALITTGVANPSTGRYTITITVGTATTNESLKLTATGAIGSETRYASYGTQVVDYDTATLVNQILTTLGTAGSGLTAIGDARLDNLDAEVSSRLAPTVAGRTLNVSAGGEGDAVLNTEYLFDDGSGRLAIKANVTHYQGTLQGNGDLPAKMDNVYNRIGAPAGDSIAADIAAIEGGAGGTGWTEEQREYILEQLALLTVSGASVVVTSGVYMCARGDVEQVYGNANTATWADLNNNQNSSEITSRINYHIAIADNYIRSVLTQGAWVMPVEGDTIPAILAYNCARLAGVLLYEGRGVTDYDPKGRAIHQLSNHKNGVDSFLKSVVYGSTDLSPLVKSSTNEAPTAS